MFTVRAIESLPAEFTAGRGCMICSAEADMVLYYRTRIGYCCTDHENNAKDLMKLLEGDYDNGKQGYKRTRGKSRRRNRN
jgi:hypothetical protein